MQSLKFNDNKYLSDLFNKIVREVCLDEFGKKTCREVEDLIPNIPCPDQYLGKIQEFSDSDGDFPQREDVDRVLEQGLIFENAIIVILESPHKREFAKCGRKWRAMGPACSCTGCLFRRHWSEIAGKYKFSTKGNLFFVNAIRYQCSLGFAESIVTDKKLRERIKSRVLCGCFFDRNGCFSKDLYDRVNRIVKQCSRSCVIVNACTRSKGCVKCHNAISRLIKKFHTDNLYDTTHPSSWYSLKNRKFKSL